MSSVEAPDVQQIETIAPLSAPLLLQGFANDGNAPVADPVKQSRRLPDRILVAVHQACDIGALEVASSLLGVLNDVLRHAQPGPQVANRRAIEGMVAAHHRLWHLRHGQETVTRILR